MAINDDDEWDGVRERREKNKKGGRVEEKKKGIRGIAIGTSS
jgi:hypothetical protein